MARTMAHWTAGNCSLGTTATSASLPISVPAGSTTLAPLISDRYSTWRSLVREPLEFTHHPNGRDASCASALEALTDELPSRNRYPDARFRRQGGPGRPRSRLADGRRAERQDPRGERRGPRGPQPAGPRAPRDRQAR